MVGLRHRVLLLAGIMMIMVLVAACGTEAEDTEEPAAGAGDEEVDAGDEPADGGDDEEDADAGDDGEMDDGEAAGDFPSQPIIFVAPGTLGGGSDTQARIASDIVTESGIFGEEPVAVLNRGGGGNQDAMVYIRDRAGDPHHLLTFQPSLITYVLLGEAAYDLDDFTPIANVVQDPTIMITRPDSGYESLEDVIEAGQTDPDNLQMGGGGVSGPDRMGLLQLQEAADFESNYVPFAGGGEIHQNILGGHVDVAVGNPSDFMASIESGDLVGLVLLDEERSTAPELEDIPTASELGYDVAFSAWRGWFAPADIPEDALDTLVEGFREVTEDPRFQEEYADRFGMRVDFIPHEEFVPYLEEREQEYVEILTEAGVIE